MRLSFGKLPSAKPAAGKVKLLLTIAGAFATGAVLGAGLAGRYGHLALLIPVAGVTAGGVYALVGGRFQRGRR